MNNAKICAALKQTDELGNSLPTGCVLAQLFLGAGRTEEEIEEEMRKNNREIGYISMFNRLLSTEYDLTDVEIANMISFNDNCLPVGTDDKKERHSLILAKYCN